MCNDEHNLTNKDNLERYQAVRAYITHEDSLINNRLTWLLVSQGLIFGAFSGLFVPISNLVFKLEEKCDSNALISTLINLQFFQFILGILGLSIVCVCYVSINAALLSIDEIKNKFNHLAAATKLPELTGGGSEGAVRMGAISSSGIPIVLGCVWIVVIMKLLASFF
jgi:hypothetical protein